MNVDQDVCSTREAAALLGVSVKTIQLWVESGVLRAWKTPGGHRRVSRESVLNMQSQRRAAIRAPDDGTRRGVSAINGADQTAAQDARFSILVVDDDEDVRSLYESVISSWALPVALTTATDGFDALVLIGNAPPDLLITDLAMPGMDGFRMLRFLVANSVSKDLDIVVISGLDETEIRQNGGLPASVTCYQKPVPFDRLRAYVDAAIAAR